MTEVLIACIVLVCLVLFLVLRIWKQPVPPPENSQQIIMMQQQVESLRTDLRSSLQHVGELVDRQMSAVTQQLQAQTSTVGNRLDSAAKVIGDVQRNLGELGKATAEIKELGQNVSKLDELLRAPKFRGGLGEYLLEDLLKQVLPEGQYEMQYHFRNGAVVDAVIHTSDRLVPIDSKFPLENFRKMTGAIADAEKKPLQRAFVADVKKHIDAIASKYILEDEDTFSFALMYIPAENIYYEIIIKDELANGVGLYNYAIERKVIPVSPNSFYAYLQVIALGLRHLRIEQSAAEIVNALAHLQGDLAKVREVFDVVGVHLDNAGKKYEEADKRLSKFESRLEGVADHRLQEGAASPVEAGERLLDP